MSRTDPQRPLHPHRGIQQPRSGTPLRLPGSIRRTSTVDMLRPDGLRGPVVVDARARDLITGPDGVAGDEELTTLRAEIDVAAGRLLRRIDADPPEPGLQELTGAVVGPGFRGKVAGAVAGHRAAATRLHLLLDDLPVANLVSGYALQAGGAIRPGTRVPLSGMPDLCSGWRSGGTIMVELERAGLPPLVTGPPAPDLADVDDPLGWHRCDPMPAHTVRRTRRLDLRVEGGTVILDSLFRDSHVGADGEETVIHEYGVRGRANRAGWSILSLVATPHVLPWQECPVAAGSAGRLAGSDLRSLREEVKAGFVGTSTCTHLNDQLRQLGDVPALTARLLEAQS